MTADDQSSTPTTAFRKRNPWRENIEGLLMIGVLVLMIRHFVFEVFQIPTGSMAPTLLGQHRDLVCPNCGLEFPVDYQAVPNNVQAICPNCGRQIPDDIVRSSYGRSFPSWPGFVFWPRGNRVIVNKFLGHLHPPERWNIVVFRHPQLHVQCLSCGYDSSRDRRRPVGDGVDPERCPRCGSTKLRKEHRNFIKRLIGLPGETIVIKHGDIYADGQLQRKPSLVQRELWRLVYAYDGNHVPVPKENRDADWEFHFPLEGAVGGWQLESGAPEAHAPWKARSGSFEESRGVLKLIPGPDDAARVEYHRGIVDFTAYNGLRPRFFAPVGDLRWDVDVKLDGPGLLQLHLREDDSRYTATVRFGDASGKTSLSVDGRSVEVGEFTADPSVAHRVQFSNADDRLELHVDGKRVLEHSYDVPMAEVREAMCESGASLGVIGTAAAFDRIRLYRDVYYLQGENNVFDIPPDCYFFMGDNTSNSDDSRMWGTVPAENLIGRTTVIWWPLSHLRSVY